MIRTLALFLLRSTGVFALARMLTRKGLRILCYHGVALEDEDRFRPYLFIRPDQLEQRLRYLVRKRFSVLSLDDALARMDRGGLSAGSVVITFDDGFFSTLATAWPLLDRYAAPATLYLSTYYVENQAPVFNLAIPYLFWKTQERVIDLEGLDVPPPAAKRHDWARLNAAQRASLVEAVTTHGNHRPREARTALLRSLAKRLDVDVDHLDASRKLGFVTPSEVRELHRAGMGIELHTHRHRSPNEHRAAIAEIVENRDIIERETGRAPEHFCYPSGRAERWNDDWLAQCGIRSATTTAPGMNYPETPRFHLRRFLDHAGVAQIEFEAEMCGLLELARRLRAWLRA